MSNLRVLLGDLSGSFVAKVSKPGFDADTATADQLLFDSTIVNAKVIAQGDVSYSGSAIVINFGMTLSAIPVVMVASKFSGQIQDGDDFNSAYSYFVLTVTTSSVTIPGGGATASYSYIVLSNEAY